MTPKLGIRRKFLIIFLGISLSVISLCAIVFQTLDAVKTHETRMSFSYQQIELSEEMLINGQNLIREFGDVFAGGAGEVEGPSDKQELIETHNEVIKLVERYRSVISSEEEFLKAEGSEEEEEEEEEKNQIENLLTTYMGHYTKLDAILSSSILLSEKNKKFRAYKESSFEDSWPELIQGLIDDELKEIRSVDNKIKAKFAFIELIAWIAIAATFLIFLFAYFWVLKGVTQPLEEFIEVSNQIAKGQFDFKLDYTQNDEVGTLSTALNNMGQELKTSKENLIQSKNSAEKANQAKSEFLSRMSHELRTPMNAILGFTQLIKMDSNNGLSNSHNENLERVLSAGNHLLVLINEVLDISTIESGKLGLSVETIDIVPIVDNVISISKQLANERGISLEYQTIPEENYFAEVDPLRLKQVVLNLISNAIKYNKPNGSVIISYEKPNSGTIRLGIKDTGFGIPDDKKDLVFKPFERVDIESEYIEGSGIGLTISQKLIKLMNGSIGFESELGEGSNFHIDIPVSNKTPLAVKTENKIGLNLSSQTENHTGKILYIEDIPGNIDLVEQVLSQHKPSIKLLSAPNALDGIKVAQTQTPDLIFMDIHLPGMNGIEAFKSLQSLDKVKDIPVIALTADAMDADIKSALKMGFKDYITKPIDVHKFLIAINKVIK
jgi:signal transduction histidine kinase